MRLSYVRMNPCGNITILVETGVPRGRQPELAERLMAAREVGGEQVGYLETPSLPGARLRLQMMGGEFCGNASMSLAALLAARDGLREGEERTYQLEVSGAEGLVECRARREGDGFRGRVRMPSPESVREEEICPGLRAPVVRLPGIAHAIVPEGALRPREAEAIAPELCARLGAEALGLMLVDGELKWMRPLVYVASTKSLVWEQGCGSGTAALGAYLAARSGREARVELAQPGGVIGARARWTLGAPGEVEIFGRVQIERAGEAELDGSL